MVRIIIKEPFCKTCGGRHYSIQCFKRARRPLAKVKPLYSYNKLTKNPKQQSQRRSVKPRAQAIRELDRVFSIYIRTKNSISNYAWCVTCGKKDLWKNMQNGHYIGRSKFGTRWDEVNCHVQCAYCNENLGGNLSAYKEYMINNYGTEALDNLRLKSNKLSKKSVSELTQLIEKYSKIIEIYL